MTPDLHQYHDLFCKITGHELNFTVQERRWFEFAKAGYTVEDLRITLEHLKAQNRKNDFQYSLKVHNVIGDLEKFDSICGEAKAFERNRRTKSAKQSVIESWRPTVGEHPSKGHARHISELLKVPPSN